MGKKQRDCVTCGAPVGIIGRELCCLCMRRLREVAAKTGCPGCGKDRVLKPETGHCVLCSKICRQCAGPVRAKDSDVCRPCQRRAERESAKAPCPRCGNFGFLREVTGWCGTCSRPRQLKDPPRICEVCGELRRHGGLGMCSRCWQRDADRPLRMGERVMAALADPPDWLPGFITYVADRHCAPRACSMISAIRRLLADGGSRHPQAVLDRSRQPGRSMGTLARGLEDYFTRHRLALPTDQEERLAAGRRARRVEATPEPLRPAVASFCAAMLTARVRARRAGTRPRTDNTIEHALATVRDFAVLLIAHGKPDWALVDITDVEAFLADPPKSRKRRLGVLRQFFAHARANRLVLIDPTRGLSAKEPRGFRGQALTLGQQRALFRRWTTDADVHPHECLVGILALLHGAASQEVRLLTIDDIDAGSRSVQLGERPLPVPLDPASWQVLQRALEHRTSQRTDNPHVIVTRGTKAGRSAASTAYLSHVLDGCGIAPRTIRNTRLVELVNTMDPKLVAAAFGMNPEGVMLYLSDRVDEGRLPEDLAERITRDG